MDNTGYDNSRPMDDNKNPTPVQTTEDAQEQLKRKSNAEENADKEMEDVALIRQQLPEYEQATYDAAAIAPPYEQPPKYEPPKNRQLSLGVPNITEAQIRDALVGLATDTRCYGTTAAKNMTFNETIHKAAYRYTLETFTEKREVELTFESAHPEMAISQGESPSPWDIPLPPLEHFIEHAMTAEVPNTAEIRTCTTCKGGGKSSCTVCSGSGKIPCPRCGGSGSTSWIKPDGNIIYNACLRCNYSGRAECSWCSGSGLDTCETCHGHKALRFFIKLTVTWINHVEEFVSQTSNFPNELITTDINGHKAFEERYPKVFPITQFPEESIILESQRIISKHETEFPLEKILEQRQRIEIVPIAEVLYQWKEKSGNFNVYGFENHIHFPDYPQMCCWGCTVL